MSFFEKIKGNKKVIYSIIGSVCALSLIVAITVPVALNSKSQNSITINNQNFEVIDYKSNYEPYNNLFNFDSLKNKNISEIDKSLIESTINQNNINFSVTILDHIIKNNDLNFVTFYYRLADKPNSSSSITEINGRKRKDFIFSKTIFLNGEKYENNIKEISWEKFDQIAIQNGSKTNGVKAYLDSKFGKSFVNAIFGLDYDIQISTGQSERIFKPDKNNNILQSTFSMFELAKQTLGNWMEISLHYTGIGYPYITSEENKDPSTSNIFRFMEMPISTHSFHTSLGIENKNLFGIPFGIGRFSHESHILNISKEKTKYKYFEVNNNKYFELFINDVELLNIIKNQSKNLSINKKLYINVTDWNLNDL